MNKLTPENDTQELWALSGKVEAVLLYIENCDYPKPGIIYSMLGGEQEVAE